MGAGHDFNPLVFTAGANEWSFLDKLEKKKEVAKETSSGGFAASRCVHASFYMFINAFCLSDITVTDV